MTDESVIVDWRILGQTGDVSIRKEPFHQISRALEKFDPNRVAHSLNEARQPLFTSSHIRQFKVFLVTEQVSSVQRVLFMWV